MGAFLPLYSVYSDCSTLSRKKQFFSKAATFSVLICVPADIRSRMLHVSLVRNSRFKKVTEKIMTEFSDLNLCPINNRQGIVIDGEGSKVICKD